MTIRPTRWWFTAITITGRFYIMFAVMLLCVASVVFGALRTTELRAEASADLARAAAVQRSLDRALTVLTGITAQLQQPTADASTQNLLTALKAQLEATWALPATGEIGAILDTLHAPAAKFYQATEGFLRDGAGGSGATTWAFAELEPRRAALETGIKESMTRMRGVLGRFETRV